MGYLLQIVLLVLCVNIVPQYECQSLKNKANIPVPKLITAAGYPSEKHRVLTEDGYFLQMHRIPAGRRTARRSEPATKGKKAVLILHGLLGSSSDFVIMGPERGLPYLLADAGYDVWLGNCRGNIYSSHKIYSKSDPRFWEFSFHEHGKYDAPAMIDRVLNVTGLPKLLFVGYSMGTTSFFTMISQRPEYNDKIISFVGLAPAVYLANMQNIATMLLKNFNLPDLLKAEGFISVSLRPQLSNFIFRNLCPMRNPREDLCYTIIYSIVGEDFEQNDWERMQEVLNRMQPGSWRQFEHYGKIAITGVFTSWDGGLLAEPKPYNLTNVRVPVSLLYGENDLLTAKTEIMKLAEDIKKNGMLEEVGPGCHSPKFNHLDFVFAKDVGILLNKPLVTRIDKLFNKYG